VPRAVAEIELVTRRLDHPREVLALPRVEDGRVYQRDAGVDSGRVDASRVFRTHLHVDVPVGMVVHRVADVGLAIVQIVACAALPIRFAQLADLRNVAGGQRGQHRASRHGVSGAFIVAYGPQAAIEA
jgi:hypothetical protein